MEGHKLDLDCLSKGKLLSVGQIRAVTRAQPILAASKLGLWPGRLAISNNQSHPWNLPLAAFCAQLCSSSWPRLRRPLR